MIPCTGQYTQLRLAHSLCPRLSPLLQLIKNCVAFIGVREQVNV